MNVLENELLIIYEKYGIFTRYKNGFVNVLYKNENGNGV